MKGLRKEKNKMKFENIKKVNEKLFETIEKTLEEKQFFEFKIKGKIEKFDWLKEASREVKTSKGIKTSKMYVFEKRYNKISSTFFKSRANDFDTIPYKNIQEYKEYRNSTISLKLIREKKDFEALELKILNKNKKILNSEYKIKNKNFKGMNAIKIINLLRYYFEGKIEISIFNGKTQKEIADILNSLKISEREITVNDIKNAKRKERKAYIPISEISDIIKLLRKLS